jgi:hypothetical protein
MRIAAVFILAASAATVAACSDGGSTASTNYPTSAPYQAPRFYTPSATPTTAKVRTINPEKPCTHNGEHAVSKHGVAYTCVQKEWSADKVRP